MLNIKQKTDEDISVSSAEIMNQGKWMHVWNANSSVAAILKKMVLTFHTHVYTLYVIGINLSNLIKNIFEIT